VAVGVAYKKRGSDRVYDPSAYTVRSEIRCAFRLQYINLVVSIEVAVEACCYFSVFSC
jgi:hypothetical protein